MNTIKAKLLGKNEIQRSMVRLAHEIIEKNNNLINFKSVLGLI